MVFKRLVFLEIGTTSITGVDFSVPYRIIAMETSMMPSQILLRGKQSIAPFNRTSECPEIDRIILFSTLKQKTKQKMEHGTSTQWYKSLCGYSEYVSLGGKP